MITDDEVSPTLAQPILWLDINLRLTDFEQQEVGGLGTVCTQEIPIGDILLKWSDWFPWDRFLEDARRGGLRVPTHPGIYEAKQKEHEVRLTIGKAANLRMRVKQGLVKGTVPHSAGKRIRDYENTSTIVIRWAETSRPSCVEEFLHQEHKIKHGKLPRYVDHT